MPQMMPAMSVRSRANSVGSRQMPIAPRISVAPAERHAACVSGGMSASATFAAT